MPASLAKLAAGVSDTLWNMEQIVDLIDTRDTRTKQGPLTKKFTLAN